MTRAVRALIDLNALRHNLRRVRQAAPGCRVVAMIKADAYGHGAVRVARALADADAFGVARTGEALELREAGVRSRILVMAGPRSDADLSSAAQHGLDLVLHHESQVRMLEAASAAAPVPVWLKLDTGMHRLGFPPERAQELWARLRRCAAVRPPVRVMTHLAGADERGARSARRQLDVFFARAGGLGAELSVANSAGVLGWPASHTQWVRPGIMLYGVSPFVGGSGERDGLRPVMTLGTHLIAVNAARKGDAIGYAGDWVCPEDMPVGVATIGYGDGYPRHARSGTPVLVNGQRVPLVGRVSMDLVTLDLRSRPDARPGDPVVLWGRGLPAEEVAECAGTIAYELLCRVARRVEFVEEE